MKTPLITVMTPVYNGEKYLREMMDSILTQTQADFEFIMINDGSTDNTESIIKSYNDPRIKYFANDGNKGAPHTSNRILELAKGEFIASAEADDINHPRRLEIQSAFMQANESVGVLSCNVLEFRSKPPDFSKCDIPPTPTAEITPKQFRGAMFARYTLAHSALMMRKSVLDEHGIRYNPKWWYGSDMDIIYRLGVATDGIVLRDQLVLYRYHQDSNTRKAHKNRHKVPVEAPNVLAEFLDTHYGIQIPPDKNELNPRAKRLRRRLTTLAILLITVSIGFVIGRLF